MTSSWDKSSAGAGAGAGAGAPKLVAAILMLVLHVAAPATAQTGPMGAAEEREKQTARPVPTPPPQAPRMGRSEAGQALSLDSCLEIASKRSPQLRAYRANVQARDMAVRGAKGAYGPVLRVEGLVQRWHDEFAPSFQPPGTDNSDELPAVVAREKLTGNGSVSLTQPLIGLFAIRRNVKQQKAGLQSAKAQYITSARNLKFEITSSYYRLLEGMELVEVAKLSVEQLDAQVSRSRSFLARGATTKNEVLRAQVALASAKQGLLASEGQVAIEQARLAQLIGLDPGYPIRPQRVPVDELIQTADLTSELPGHQASQQLSGAALRRRSEVQESQSAEAQAGAAVSIAKSRLYPQVDLVGAYQRNYGYPFGQPDWAAYVGLQGSWDLWNWGTNYRAIDEAEATRVAAKAQTELLKDQLGLEIQTALINFKTAQARIAEAKVAYEQAEENFRIEQSRYEVSVNTSFDVIEAQAALAQAHASLLSAVYETLIARAEWERVTATG